MSPERRRKTPGAMRQADSAMWSAQPALLTAVSISYTGLSLGVWQLADPTEFGAPWWPAAGLTLGVLCRLKPAH